MIYIVEAQGLQKIKMGFTSVTFGARLAVIQTGSPVWIIPLLVWPGATKREEMLMHQAFEGDRFQGEWYWYTDAMRTFILSLSRSLGEKGVTF